MFNFNLTSKLKEMGLAIGLALAPFASQAKTLDLIIGDPTIDVLFAESEFSVDLTDPTSADLVTFGPVDFSFGIALPAFSDAELLISFDPVDPIESITGDLLLIDALTNETLLSASNAVGGFGSGVVELMLQANGGTLSSDFAEGVFVELFLIDPFIGDDPFGELQDGTTYDSSLTISAVVAPVPVPASLPLLAAGFLSIATLRRRR